MSHSAPWWCGDTRNKADNGLVCGIKLLQEFGRIFLSWTSNFSDHDYAISLLILHENLQAVDEVGAGEWVTANSNNKRLAKTCLCSLVDSLVCQSSRSRDDTNATALVDKSGHNTNLALAWRNDTWAIGSDQTSLSLCLQNIRNPYHICQLISEIEMQ